MPAWADMASAPSVPIPETSADQFVNMAVLGIPAPPPAVPLPLSAGGQAVQQYQAKFQVQADVFPNVMIGIPVPVVVVGPDTHDGWDSHRIHDYWVWRERDLKAAMAALQGKSNKKSKRLFNRAAAELEKVEAERREALESEAREHERQDENSVMDFLLAEDERIAELLEQALPLLNKRPH
jgi:hypothetical protein